MSLSIDYQPDDTKVVMALEHNGEGFDHSVLKKDDDQSLTHGRGIVLASELCDSLEYSKQGKCVTAVYRLTQSIIFRARVNVLHCKSR